MKFLILLVFCFDVRATVFETGFKDACGLKRTESCDYGLRNNEKYVTKDANIIEPCDLDDYDCMRDFMADNSDCKPVDGLIPDPVYLKQFTLFFPSSNLILTFTKTTVVGLREATVSKFYYNLKTKVLVFSIDISALSFDIPKFYFCYRTPGLESICKSDFANATFESLTFTASISKVNNKFRLDLANLRHGYVGKAFPAFFLGPASFTSTDLTVVTEFASFLTTIPLDARTAFLFLPEIFTSLFIQTYLCDFGVDYYTM